jgi:membrane protease YdiL (CAAX protease family)
MSAIALPAASASSPARAAPIASRAHTIVVVSIFVALAVAGAFGQARAHRNPAIVPSPASTIPLYLSLIAAEWALVLYVRRGVRRTGTTVVDLLGGTIGARRKMATDVFLGAGLWVGWALIEMASAHWWGASTNASLRPFLARRLPEIPVWIALSMSAAFAEEVVFRGYLQRQFTALTGSASLALVTQAGLFGVSHGYQGLAACAKITVFGILFGLLALWQRRLRPGIIAHALTDIIAGLA